MNIKLYALLPCLNTEVGHIYEYCCSASKAASMSGWKLVGVIPKSCAINNLPDHWIKTLSFDPWDEKRGFLPRIFTVIKNIHPFFRLLKIAKKDSDTQAIFFIEHGLQHLFGLIIALSLTSYRPELWILHRYTYDTQKTRASIYKFFHKILQWQLGRKKIKLMTDSDLLAKAQQKLFCSKIFLLPIPHTPLNLDSQLRKKPSKHLLWWPGGSIREEKGLNLVQMLANHLTPNMQLILAEKARPFFHPETKHLHFIKTNLLREEYEKWMQTVDFVLLPYCPKIYHSSTSGIFVEAITSGAIPLTTEGTWMAYELKKHNLSQLIVDWNGSTLDQLDLIKSDTEILENHKKMQKYYQEFHSTRGFAKKMAQIFLK